MKGKDGNNYFHLACSLNKVEFFRPLIDNGVDFVSVNDFGRTGLHLFCDSFEKSDDFTINYRALCFLCKSEVLKDSIDLKDSSGRTAYDLYLDRCKLLECRVSRDFTRILEWSRESSGLSVCVQPNVVAVKTSPTSRVSNLLTSVSSEPPMSKSVLDSSAILTTASASPENQSKGLKEKEGSSRSKRKKKKKRKKKRKKKEKEVNIADFNPFGALSALSLNENYSYDGPQFGFGSGGN